MNQQEARAALIKQSRRSILDSLKLVDDLPLSFGSLRMVFPDVEAADLRKDITYLLRKGYVERVRETANESWDSRLYQLTAQGTEIADKINLDPALEP